MGTSSSKKEVDIPVQSNYESLPSLLSLETAVTAVCPKIELTGTGDVVVYVNDISHKVISFFIIIREDVNGHYRCLRCESGDLFYTMDEYEYHLMHCRTNGDRCKAMLEFGPAAGLICGHRNCVITSHPEKHRLHYYDNMPLERKTKEQIANAEKSRKYAECLKLRFDYGEPPKGSH